MIVVRCVVWQFWDSIALRQMTSQRLVVDLTDPATLGLDIVNLFELCPQEGSVEL